MVSRVDLLPGAALLTSALIRARAWLRSAAFRQLRTFAVIGVASTLAYVGLYAALRTALSAAASNALALLVTAIGNTAANRRLTFEVRGRAGVARHHVAGFLAFGVAFAITSASLGLLQVVAPGAGRSLELAALIAANVLATLARFILLRSWIDRGQTASPMAAAIAAERISR